MLSTVVCRFSLSVMDTKGEKTTVETLLNVTNHQTAFIRQKIRLGSFTNYPDPFTTQGFKRILLYFLIIRLPFLCRNNILGPFYSPVLWGSLIYVNTQKTVFIRQKNASRYHLITKGFKGTLLSLPTTQLTLLFLLTTRLPISVKNTRPSSFYKQKFRLSSFYNQRVLGDCVLFTNYQTAFQAETFVQAT